MVKRGSGLFNPQGLTSEEFAKRTRALMTLWESGRITSDELHTKMNEVGIAPDVNAMHEHMRKLLAAPVRPNPFKPSPLTPAQRDEQRAADRLEDAQYRVRERRFSMIANYAIAMLWMASVVFRGAWIYLVPAVYYSAIAGRRASQLSDARRDLAQLMPPRAHVLTD